MGWCATYWEPGDSQTLEISLALGDNLAFTSSMVWDDSVDSLGIICSP